MLVVATCLTKGMNGREHPVLIQRSSKSALEGLWTAPTFPHLTLFVSVSLRVKDLAAATSARSSSRTSCTAPRAKVSRLRLNTTVRMFFEHSMWRCMAAHALSITFWDASQSQVRKVQHLRIWCLRNQILINFVLLCGLCVHLGINVLLNGILHPWGHSRGHSRSERAHHASFHTRMADAHSESKLHKHRVTYHCGRNLISYVLWTGKRPCLYVVEEICGCLHRITLQ